jgi:hypothetical protein
MHEHMHSHSPQASSQSDGGDDWLRAGQLLIAAEMLTQENLDSAITLAARMRMPLDRILSMHGYLTEAVLNSALKVQALVSNKRMSQEAAIKALQIVKEGGKLADDPVQKPRTSVTADQPLGDTLKSIGAITAKQLKVCMDSSLETGLPVGWILASQGMINHALLGSAITAQRLSQRNIITQEAALDYLRTARMQQKAIRKVLKENEVSTKDIDSELLLGHILLESGVLVKTELLACREFALLQNSEFSQVLLDLGMLTKEAWSAVETIYGQLSDGSISTAQAIDKLQKLQRVKWDLNLLEKEEPPEPQLQVSDLIGLAGLLPAEKLQKVVDESRKTSQPLSALLVDGALLQSVVLDCLEKCKTFTNGKLLSLHKAIILLTYCADHGCSLEEALFQFGWTVGQSPG